MGAQCEVLLDARFGKHVGAFGPAHNLHLPIEVALLLMVPQGADDQRYGNLSQGSCAGSAENFLSKRSAGSLRLPYRL